MRLRQVNFFLFFQYCSPTFTISSYYFEDSLRSITCFTLVGKDANKYSNLNELRCVKNNCKYLVINKKT